MWWAGCVLSHWHSRDESVASCLGQVERAKAKAKAKEKKSNGAGPMKVWSWCAGWLLMQTCIGSVVRCSSTQNLAILAQQAIHRWMKSLNLPNRKAGSVTFCECWQLFSYLCWQKGLVWDPVLLNIDEWQHQTWGLKLYARRQIDVRWAGCVLSYWQTRDESVASCLGQVERAKAKAKAKEKKSNGAGPMKVWSWCAGWLLMQTCIGSVVRCSSTQNLAILAQQAIHRWMKSLNLPNRKAGSVTFCECWQLFSYLCWQKGLVWDPVLLNIDEWQHQTWGLKLYARRQIDVRWAGCVLSYWQTRDESVASCLGQVERAKAKAKAKEKKSNGAGPMKAWSWCAGWLLMQRCYFRIVLDVCWQAARSEFKHVSLYKHPISWRQFMIHAYSSPTGQPLMIDLLEDAPQGWIFGCVSVDKEWVLVQLLVFVCQQVAKVPIFMNQIWTAEQHRCVVQNNMNRR